MTLPQIDNIDPKELEAVLSQYDDQTLRLIVDAGRARRAGSEFTERAFCDWYFILYGKELPPYARDVWTPKIFSAYRNRTGVLIEGFRGATKSSFIFAWALFVTGHNPVGSTVVIRINDTAAAETGKAMASIIADSPSWKSVFPHIVPIQSRWSTEGYYIRDDKYEEGEWNQMCIADHLSDPSLLLAGITSGSHIGKHPSNGWYFDDFHDAENTRSAREMRNIVEIIESNLTPTWNRPEGHPVLAGACTLWDEKDGYHALMRTGLFEHVMTPIFSVDRDGDVEYEGIAHHGEKIKLAWPEAFPMDRIMGIEAQDPLHFPMNYLCDLTSAKGVALKKEWLHEFPIEKIDPSWPVYFGIDFASTEDKLRDKNRDYFALAIGRVIPGGGVALVGGFREKLSTGEAITKVKALAAMYPTLQVVGVEKWGKGEEFKTQLLYTTNLPVLPLPLEGSAVRSKGKRYQDELAPMFMMSRAWIADVKDDFLLAFQDEWIGWDGGKSKTGHDDTLDAVYWMCVSAAGHLMPNATAENLLPKRVSSHNPLQGIGAFRGY